MNCKICGRERSHNRHEMCGVCSRIAREFFYGKTQALYKETTCSKCGKVVKRAKTGIPVCKPCQTKRANKYGTAYYKKKRELTTK